MVKPEDVKVGSVFRYHPVLGVDTSQPVRIEMGPWQLRSGDWICQARNLWTGAVVRPCLEALSVGETQYGSP